MSTPEKDSPAVSLGEGTDITVDPSELEVDDDVQPATSDAEALRDDGETLGGTGGADAGGAG